MNDAHSSDWFTEARFGLFIHWGLYSIQGRGEWVMLRDKVPVDEYATLADQFQPNHYDADAWAATAVDAGMRYAVLTTRHHDGFCLWDSAVSDFTSVKTAAKRDIVAEYVTAMRKAGLRVGLYYSLLDWRYPAYWKGPVKDPEGWELYIKRMHEEVRELCTQYGKIDVFWFDGFWPYDAVSWRSEELLAMIRELQPGILINNRACLPGDFDTPESAIIPSQRRWEACQTMQSSWGYHEDEKVIKAWDAINRLCICASRGGNLLLNVGPRADGRFPEECINTLKEVGVWMRQHGEGIYGSLRINEYFCHVMTRSKDTIYVHFRWGEGLHWPNWGPYTIEGVKDKIVKAWIPATGQEVPCEWKEGRVTITVPEEFPKPFGTVALRVG